jgi:hypothetical protein
MSAQTRSRLGRRLAWVAVLGLVSVAVLVPTTKAAAEKVTICHATGSEGNPYVAIKVPPNSGYEPHLDDNGSPLNGHEQDFLLENTDLTDCDNVPDPTEAPTATPTDAPTATPTGSVLPTQTTNPTDPPTAAPTGSVEAATATAARTLPSTSTIDGSGSGPMNDGWRVVLLALAGVLAAALLLTPATAVVRKADRKR